MSSRGSEASSRRDLPDPSRTAAAPAWLRRAVLRRRIPPRHAESLHRGLRHPDPERREAARAEAEVARKLLERGCRVEVEVPTPDGHRCDFLVERQGVRLYLHVKRWAPHVRPVRRPIPPELRALEGGARSLLVALRWRTGLRGAGRSALAAAAAEFLRTAHVGDERIVRHPRGGDLGALSVLAPLSAGEGIRFAVGADAEVREEIPRLQSLLRKAFHQFMPRATNVIVVASAAPGHRRLVETSLLGSVVERWDRFPPRGQRVAHGRADDGFWVGGRWQSSRAAAWIQVEGRGRRHAWWARPGEPLSPAEAQLLTHLFGAAAQPSPT